MGYSGPVDSEFTQPPPIMEEEQPEADPFKKEGSFGIDEIIDEEKS